MTISQYYEIDWYSRRECQVGTEVRLEIIVVLRRRSRSKTEVRSGSRLQFQRLFYCTRSKWYSYCVSSCSLFLIETADEARVSNWSLHTIDNQLMHAILHQQVGKQLVEVRPTCGNSSLKRWSISIQERPARSWYLTFNKRDGSNQQVTLASVWSMTAVVFEKGSSDDETRPTNSIDSFIFSVRPRSITRTVNEDDELTRRKTDFVREGILTTTTQYRARKRHTTLGS